MDDMSDCYRCPRLQHGQCTCCCKADRTGSIAWEKEHDNKDEQRDQCDAEEPQE